MWELCNALSPGWGTCCCVSLPTAKVIKTGTPHLQDGQRQLRANGCPRVVTGHMHQLVLQMKQDCPPLCQPLLGVLQLPLNPLVEFDVVIFAAQPALHILHSTRHNFKSAAGATKQLDRIQQEAKQI